MTKHIDVEKEVSVSVGVEEVRCDCGEDLEFSLDTDAHGDLMITVEPHVCEGFE